MENKKISAVEWLHKEMYSMFCTPDMIVEFKDMLEQAKEMHKQEIVDAINLPSEKRWYNALLYNNSGEQYYNETYVNT